MIHQKLQEKTLEAKIWLNISDRKILWILSSQLESEFNTSASFLHSINYSHDKLSQLQKSPVSLENVEDLGSYLKKTYQFFSGNYEN